MTQLSKDAIPVFQIGGNFLKYFFKNGIIGKNKQTEL
jgi:hypothetical protein